MTYFKWLRTLSVVSISFVLLTIFSAIAIAQEDATATPSGYIDLQYTEIRGLTAEQVEGYRTGAGMGFALPAELNGYPGPRHVLDLADELELSEEQLTDIQALFDEMLPEAIALGEEVLVQEETIELAFREGTITDEFLRTSLLESGRLEAELRYVHLSTHLATIEILTPHQVSLYNEIRGYETSSDNDNQGHNDHQGHGN